jgi:hypothetical protein
VRLGREEVSVVGKKCGRRIELPSYDNQLIMLDGAVYDEFIGKYGKLMVNADSGLAIDTSDGSMVEVIEPAGKVVLFEATIALLLKELRSLYTGSVFVWASPDVRKNNLQLAKERGERLISYDDQKLIKRLNRMQNDEDPKILPTLAFADIIFVNLGSFEKDAERIHEEDLKLTPTIEDKTMICHIVTDSILPDMQLKEGVLNRLEVKMRDPKFGEKIVALSVKDPNNTEEFMAKLSGLKGQIETEYKGYKIQFDVACPKKELVEGIQKLGMQALAFKREGEGEIIQIEGIILALRALRAGDIASLLSAYKTITGQDYTTDKIDINELARMMLFILPVRKIDVNQLGIINKLIEKNIKEAA